MELKIKGLPEDAHKCRLNTVNIIVCLFNVAVPAMVWIFYIKEEYKAATIAFDIE